MLSMFNSKVYDYIIVCKRPDFKLVDGISQLMLFLALIVFTSSLSATSGAEPVILYILIACIMGWWVYMYYRQKRGQPVFFRIALLAGAIGWALQPGWRFIGVVYFLAAVLEKQVKFPLEIAFDAEGLVVNSLPKKQYTWSEVTNVVMKDGIVTIDLRNNKLIQKELEDDTSAGTEQEFNEFCKNRLYAHSPSLNA
ncbi:MAG: hypothetical protein JWQ78_67 [Sediminibacterium sp.]|nr:hypothetical protein [Sediminibacterium sp.]